MVALSIPLSSSTLTNVVALANCKRLLEQDPEIAKRRDNLLKEKANYERANEILNGIKVFVA